MRAMSEMINGVEYILMKDIKGNEDLHEIARNIKFEDDTCSMPKNTTRKQFIAEIKSEIEWYFDFVSPPVSKDNLNQEYLKILKIEEMERRKGKNMKNYEKVIDKRNLTQNAFALNVLLQCGRNNLLDDKFYENMIKGANGTSLMTADFQKQVYEIARNMAKLDDKGLCEYVYDKVKADKKLERGR